MDHVLHGYFLKSYSGRHHFAVFALAGTTLVLSSTIQPTSYYSWKLTQNSDNTLNICNSLNYCIGYDQNASPAFFGVTKSDAKVASFIYYAVSQMSGAFPGLVTQQPTPSPTPSSAVEASNTQVNTMISQINSLLNSLPTPSTPS